MVTTQLSIPSSKEKPQKTSDSLGNLRINITLKRVPCIWYPTTFQIKPVSIQEARSMLYTLPLLNNWTPTSDQSLLGMSFNVGVQKINGTVLNTYGMVLAAFPLTGTIEASAQLDYLEPRIRTRHGWTALRPSLQPCHQYWSEYWLDDKRLPSVCHQVKQSNWLDGRGLGKRLSKTLDKRSAKDCQIYLSVFSSLS